MRDNMYHGELGTISVLSHWACEKGLKKFGLVLGDWGRWKEAETVSELDAICQMGQFCKEVKEA